MLQFITHRTGAYDEITGTRAVLDGGCRWVQLRMKEAPAGRIVEVGREVARMCRACGATFIVDDHVELVRELGADGVHLGRNDMPVAEARRLLGSGYTIGATANTFEDVVRGAEQGADYIGLGPFRFTQTKSDRSQAQPQPRARDGGLPADSGAVPRGGNRAAGGGHRGHHRGGRPRNSRCGSGGHRPFGRTAAGGGRRGGDEKDHNDHK